MDAVMTTSCIPVWNDDLKNTFDVMANIEKVILSASQQSYIVVFIV